MGKPVARDATPKTVRTPEELARARRTRALEEPLDVRVRSGGASAAFEVRNPRHSTHYWVYLPEFPERAGALCDCTDFGRRGLGTCKHIESVMLWVSEHPGEGAASPRPFEGRPVWNRIDAAERGLPGASGRNPLEVRTPGRILIGPARTEPGRTGARAERNG